MARLPNPGSDDGTWGQILNDYLSQAHDAGGALRTNSVSTAVLQDGSVTRPKLGTANTASAGQLLGYDGTDLAWVSGSGAPDASSGTKGVVRLTNDLGGTADAPTVPGLAGKAAATTTISTGTGLSGGGDLSANRTLTVTPDTTVQKVRLSKAGTLVASRQELNLIEGGNVTITTADNAGGNRVDVTIAAAGGGASLGSASPAALGTAAAGSAVAGSHEDHVHPTTGLTLATGGGVEGLSNINSASGATSLNLANGNVFNLTLTGNVTFSFTGATGGRACSFGLYVSQDATGSRNITWPGGILWPGGTIPTATAAANTVDIYVFESINGGSTWFGAQVGANYS